MATKISVKHIEKIIKLRPISYHTVRRINIVKEPWEWQHEVPVKIRNMCNNGVADLEGFTTNFSKKYKRFPNKMKRNEQYAKSILETKENHKQQFEDHQLLMGQKRSKSNLRKVRKNKIKATEPDDISTDQAEEYLKVLKRIREGVKKPTTKKIEKHLPNVTIDKKQVKRYIKRIDKLDIISIINIEKQSLLPDKNIIDEQYNELNKIYNEITNINNSEHYENSLFHLDLYTKLLLSFGKIGRIHKMMGIYTQLKHSNLQITNDTLIEMLNIVCIQVKLTKQLWNEYFNDFRKGKICERPTYELFHAFMKNYTISDHGNGYEIDMLFKMMTQEFNIKPDEYTMLLLLQKYKRFCPPRYKSAQKLIMRMRTEYNITPNAQHYNEILNTISKKWDHFSQSYKDLEEVDNTYLNDYKNGINLTRSLKLFNTILKDKNLEIDSDLFCGVFKACVNAKMTNEKKMIAVNALFNKYLLLERDENDKNDILNERFLEISKVKLKSNIFSELLHLCCMEKRYDKVQEYYNVFTTNVKIKDRFIVDCNLFCGLIDGISCDLRRGHSAQKYEYENIAMNRIKWIENEMNKYDILCNKDIWYNWLMLAKRLELANITKYLLDKMDNFFENVLYFEFDMPLFQGVVEALYNNGNMDKALEYYNKYYLDIKLFNHWELKNTGQKEIDFHGFRSGMACVALQWILENEYPPINISKYMLQQYGNKNPNISIIIGQGHHNQRGISILCKTLMKHINTLTPSIQANRYPNNPGQLVINGNDVVKWRKFHGYQIDVLKVNDNLQMTMFI